MRYKPHDIQVRVLQMLLCGQKIPRLTNYDSRTDTVLTALPVGITEQRFLLNKLY